MASRRPPRFADMRLSACAVAAACLMASGCVGQDASAASQATPTRTPATAEPTPAATSAATPMPTPQPRHTSWGPSVAHWEEAREIVAGLSVEQQAGQVIVATYAGTAPPLGLVRDLYLGGVIVMADNVPDGPDGLTQLAAVTDQVQRAGGRPYPVLVAIDQEGGPVARVGAPATEFPPGMAHGAAADDEVSRSVAKASGTEMAALGVTMVFAPVADVTTPGDPTIGVRSPGDDPALVGSVAAAQVEGFGAGGVVGVVKHFPGHGSVPADSHLELPVQTATVDALAERDLVPFVQTVEAGVPAVMVAHIDVRDIDPGVPASLSRPVVTELLRDELGFEGVVVTDALGMAAVADRYGPAESAVAALAAGSDVLLMPTDAQAARDGIVTAVTDGTLDPERLEEAARRVVALSLHQASLGERPDLAVVGTHHDVSREVSAAAVALVEGECEGPYVGPSIRLAGGTETDRQRLAAAAEAAGLGVGAGDLVTLVGVAGSSGSGDVVVALDTPYGLASSSARTASLALFGRTPQAFAALVDVLTGRSPAPGELPVDIPGVEEPSCVS